jgi:glutathione S-transferase
MHRLYHLWLSPFCRKVRLAMAEKKLEVETRIEKVWERREAFVALNAAGAVPVLEVFEGPVLADSRAITEYLDEVYPDPPLLGRDPAMRAETRRLVAWFDELFYTEVTEYLVYEKIMKRFLGLGEPNSEAIRAGNANLRVHLQYVGWLTENRKWLAGEDMTLADIAAAAQISCVDYLGDVPWPEHPAAKDWYARIKSRPSFRDLLGDHVPGYPPSKHYADLDF